MDEQQLRAELDSVYRSLSWRITMPLRELSAVAQGKQSLATFLKRSIHFFLRTLFRSKLLERLGFTALGFFPEFRSRLWESLFPAPPEPIVAAEPEVPEPELVIEPEPVRDVRQELSPNAYAAYLSLLAMKNSH